MISIKKSTLFESGIEERLSGGLELKIIISKICVLGNFETLILFFFIIFSCYLIAYS